MPLDDALALAERAAALLLPPGAGLQMPDALRVRVVLLLETAYRRALAAESEAARLRRLVEGLTERVAGQSEILSQKAERYP